MHGLVSDLGQAPASPDSTMVVQPQRHLIVRLELLHSMARVDIQASILLSAVRDAVRETFGDFGLGCVQLTLQGTGGVTAPGNAALGCHGWAGKG